MKLWGHSVSYILSLGNLGTPLQEKILFIGCVCLKDTWNFKNPFYFGRVGYKSLDERVKLSIPNKLKFFATFLSEMPSGTYLHCKPKFGAIEALC